MILGILANQGGGGGIVDNFPDFTGYFDLAVDVSGTNQFPLTVTNSGKTADFDSGTTTGSTPDSYYLFGTTSGTQGSWLAVYKVSIPYNTTTTSALNVGFSNFVDGTPDIAQTVAFYLVRYGGGLSVYVQASNITETSDVNGIELLGTEPTPSTDYYVAVAINLDTGAGELISSFGSKDITTISNYGSGGGTVGNSLAGIPILGYLGISFTNSTSTTQTVTVELVPSSASHGLTLPSGYTNIVAG